MHATSPHCRAFVSGIIVLLLSACQQEKPKAVDPYDVASMDLKPMPAKLSNVRHTGAFADGASLSICYLDAELEKLLGAPASCPFWKV